MAKGVWKQASKDDPIFSGKVTISSHSRRKQEDKDDKLTDEELVASCRGSKEDLERWGLLDRDQLVISLFPRKRGKGWSHAHIKRSL